MSVSRSGDGYHKGNLDAVLEEAALELLAQEGTSALSLRAVARRAGVSHNAPYHHFGDRQGLLKSVAARGLRALLDAMVNARQNESTPRARLLAAGFAYVDFAREHRPLFDIIFDPEICDPREPNAITGPLVEANDRFLAETVAAALPPNTAEDLMSATIGAVWAAVHGMAVLVASHHLEPSVVRPGLAALLDVQFADS